MSSQCSLTIQQLHITPAVRTLILTLTLTMMSHTVSCCSFQNYLHGDASCRLFAPLSEHAMFSPLSALCRKLVRRPSPQPTSSTLRLE